MSNHPQELLDYWKDIEAWGRNHDPEDWPVSAETVGIFRSHLARLEPLASAGNDFARHAIATMYLVGLLYSDQKEEAACQDRDRAIMTDLLSKCAMNGMVVAFDNLVVSGTGDAGESARVAVKEFERNFKPEWDPTCGMPVYTPQWMEGAMNLWRTGRCEQGDGPNEDSAIAPSS